MNPLNPTQDQLNARLNPTPVAIPKPSQGFFRGTGDIGGILFKTGADGSIQAVNIQTADAYGLAGLDFNNKGQYGNYGGQTDALRSGLSKNLGFDYMALPEVNTGNGMKWTDYTGGNLQSFLGDSYKPASIGSQMVNTTPNTLATPTQVQTQMQNPNWNAGVSQSQTQALQNQSGFPTSNLQPGATGDEVKKLQDYLVRNGYMTQEQVNTGYGTYGPQTTAAVQALQQRLGVDNSSGPGYFGPKTLSALQGGTAGDTNTPQSNIAGQMGALGQTATPPSTTGGNPSNLAGQMSSLGAGSSDSAFNDYLGNLTPSATENDLQSQQAALEAKLKGFDLSAGQDQLNQEGQPIAHGFITGQQAALAKQAALSRTGITNDQQTIQQKLALEQAKRASSLDISRAQLEYQTQKNKDAKDFALKQQELTNSQSSTQFNQDLATKKFAEDTRQFGLQYALDQQKLAAEKAKTAASTAPSASATELKSNALTSAQDLLTKFNAGNGTYAVGGTRLLGTQYIPGTSSKDFSVQFDNLKSLLSLDNVKLLKGQGAVSDAERQLLADASSKLNLSQSEGEFKSALESIVKALGGGGTSGQTSTGLKFQIIP